MKYFLLFVSLVCMLTGSFAQGIYDVLPSSGRNELFHTFLMDRGAELWSERGDSVAAALGSVQKLQARQQQLRSDYLALLGELPAKTPLNAVIVDTVQRTDYRVEKLYFESQPKHRVTANFYIPDTGSAPYPTVLILCGHYPAAKGDKLLQDLCRLFVTNGIAALIVDPFSQGERAQIQHPTTGGLVFTGQSGTSAHTRLDVGAMLAGTSVVASALWDNHRAIDYLYSRTDVVDTARLGCTGSSGGGAQATYLCAFDQRIKVAAVNSFLMNEETLFSTIGPQTASQNLSYEGAHLIDHPDYVTLFAPKPYMILAATDDFFDVSGTHETRDEVEDVYDLLGVPENFGYFEEDSTHGYLKARREVGVRWFRSWFYNDTTPVVEPRFPFISATTLWATNDGQVVTSFSDEQTVTEISVDKANAHASDRTDFWANNTTDSCLNKVKELIRWESYSPVQVEPTDTLDRAGYTVTKMKINSGDHVPVTGLLYVPKNLSGKAPAVVYVDGRGKKVEAYEGGVIEKIFVDSGKIVLSIDVRGFGETTDNPALNESKHGNREHRNAVIAGYIGKTLIGQRVEDIMKALDVVSSHADVDTTDLTLVGIDRAGSAVIHAAALDKRVKKTVIRQSFESWLPMVGLPTQLHNLTHVVPFALEYYDLTDLVDAMPGGSVMYFDEPYYVTSIDDGLADQQSVLGQNFPNPSAVKTVIPYSLKQSGKVVIGVYDMQGRLLKSLNQGHQAAGKHRLELSLQGLNGGRYVYRLWLDGVPSGSRTMSIVN